MTHREDWRRISTKIQGFRSAVALYLDFQHVRSGDRQCSAAQLRINAEHIVEAIRTFGAKYETALPQAVWAELQGFAFFTGNLNAELAPLETAFEKLMAAATEIVAFEARLTYLLTSGEQNLRMLSERAFLHLQRCIATDKRTQESWQHAYEEGEVACERLGAAHMLTHGIFAFKVNGEGARTDLVFPDRPIGDEISRAVDRLVLTEWKRLPSSTKPATMFRRAKKQADRYRDGVLAGIELASYRYLVLVTKAPVGVPTDEDAGGCIYRHINIAIEPPVPSKAQPPADRPSVDKKPKSTGR